MEKRVRDRQRGREGGGREKINEFGAFYFSISKHFTFIDYTLNLMGRRVVQTHQVQSVSFDPVPPATVGLLSFLSANQHVSLPCHQTLQDHNRNIKIYLIAHKMHRSILLTVWLEEGFSLHAKEFYVVF